MPWLMQSPTFHCGGLVLTLGQVHIRFAVENVTLGLVFLQVVQFSPVNIMPLMLYTHFSITDTVQS